jgi:Fe-S cluster assembly ATP-binding protein
MLEIKALSASAAEDKTIIKQLDLTVNPGEVHAIMGPNGSGKSTLSNVIVGHPDYTVDGGSLRYQQQDLLALAPEERAVQGVFMSFQYPVSLPGVTMMSFLQAVMNAQRKQREEPLVDAIDLIAMAEKACLQVGLPKSFLSRSLNHEFSGGEKKRAELLQMILLQPKLIILDETDSGLDIDALRMVGDVVHHMRSPDRSFIVVTHYHRILEHIQPDHVHVMHDGKIIKSGDLSLARKLEQDGYQWVK